MKLTASDRRLPGIAETAAMLRSGELTPAALAELCLDRIRARNGELNAFVALAPDVSREAASAEEALRSGRDPGLLAGIPYALKDNICAAGIPATCASRMLQNFTPGYNASCVEALSRRGAVLLGKTNMDEFAMGSSCENSIFGPTRNPDDTGRVAGGSSGGSAAAVAAGMCFYALGTDTGGSVRAPASFCGVLGLKPTYGRVSRFGVTTFASSLDCVGIFARSAPDAAEVLRAISGPEGDDFPGADDSRTRFGAAGTQGFDFDPDDFYGMPASGPRPLRGLRVAVPADVLASAAVEGDVALAFERALSVFRAAGAIIEEINIPETAGALEAYGVINAAEAASNLARFDGMRYGYRSSGSSESDVDNSVPDVTAARSGVRVALGERVYGFDGFIAANRAEGFGAEVKRRVAAGMCEFTDAEHGGRYREAEALRERLCVRYREIFRDHTVIALPTMRTAAFRIGSVRDGKEMYAQDLLTVPASLAGVPALSVPMGRNSDGLSLGLQLVGNYFDESTLLRLASFSETVL
ncbi:MAG: aspartyl/glutamyl-tRNA amidotransferase subunit A [Clostridia bacterium]|nr:aspartyl/glutamyl-tRNA amidotransferase subunit A [Clostridia bacterium]